MDGVPSSNQQVILVAGATGQQGGALIRSLLTLDGADQAIDYHILALTRNSSSAAAMELASSYPGRVTIVQGDLDDPASVRKIFEDAQGSVGVWGVYSVMAFPGLGVSTAGEERQGKLLADIAFEYGVSLFVYSSGERGGEVDDDIPGKLQHSQESKVAVERHVKALGEKGLIWTIIRPGFFMENFLGTVGSIAAGVLNAGLKPDTKVQLVAVEDIGRVAALVFRNPEAFKNQMVPVISDNLTVTEQRDAYTRATGRPQPSVSWLVAKPLVRFNSHTQSLIRDMERVHLIQLNPPYSPPTYPTIEMTSFESWAAKQASGKSGMPKEGWNGIEIKKLLTGKL